MLKRPLPADPRHGYHALVDQKMTSATACLIGVVGIIHAVAQEDPPLDPSTPEQTTNEVQDAPALENLRIQIDQLLADPNTTAENEAVKALFEYTKRLEQQIKLLESSRQQTLDRNDFNPLLGLPPDITGDSARPVPGVDVYPIVEPPEYSFEHPIDILHGIAFVEDERTELDPNNETPDDYIVPTRELLGGARIVNLSKSLVIPEWETLRADIAGEYIDKVLSFNQLNFLVQDVIQHFRKHGFHLTDVYVPHQVVTDGVVKIAILRGKFNSVSEVNFRTSPAKWPKLPKVPEWAKLGFGKKQPKEDPKADPAVKAPAAPDAAAVFEKNAKFYKKLEGLALYPGIAHKELGLLPGDLIDDTKLAEQIRRLNSSPYARLGRNREFGHPFRRIETSYAPARENDDPENPTFKLGYADVNLFVEEQMPIRFFTGYDNQATPILGEHRIFAGGAHYNLTGHDDQFGLQGFGSADLEKYKGVLLNYRLPIKRFEWDHLASVFGSYTQASIPIPPGGGGQPLDQEGTTYQFGTRYAIPLPAPWNNKIPIDYTKRKFRGYFHELEVGVDYKRSDSNLIFGGARVFDSAYDVFQGVLEYRGREVDSWGETLFSLTAFMSPGDVTGDNSDDDYQVARSGASAQYTYARASLERDIKLDTKKHEDNTFVIKLRTLGQFSGDNLVASEQLGLGGYETVRGYPERLRRGDSGFFLRGELYSPDLLSLKKTKPSAQSPDKPVHTKTKHSLKTLVFYDYGYGEIAEPFGQEKPSVSLASTGLGLRYKFGNHITAFADIGFQLDDLNADSVTQLESSSFDVFGEDTALHVGIFFSLPW